MSAKKKKKKKPMSALRTNAIVLMQVHRRANASGQLLAAEADYLTVYGWTPLVILGPSGDEGPANVWWSKGGMTTQQSKAVAYQKSEDPMMQGPR